MITFNRKKTHQKRNYVLKKFTLLPFLFYWLLFLDLFMNMPSDECQRDIADDKSTLIKVIS